MPVRRSLPPAVLAAALVVAAGGCSRMHTRRGPGRAAVPSPLARDPGPLPPIAAPVPPAPPRLPTPLAEPAVAPPRPDALTGIVPPMPAPGAVPDRPGPVAQTEPDRLSPARERVDQRRDPPPPPAPTSPAAAPANDLAEVRRLVEAAAERYAGVPDFEARLVKREVVNGRELPQDEILYRFRQQPVSVSMKVLSEHGQGREVLYVRGQFGDKIHVLTGKGDSRLVGAGYRTEMSPDDRQATAKSRYKIYEAGFARTLAGLSRLVAAAGRGDPVGLRSLGLVSRPEHGYPLAGVEIAFRPGDDPHLPRGGRRQVFFDPNPESASYLLPILVTAAEPDGREVEYYSFDRFRVPSGLSAADWHPDRLGKR